MGFYDIIYDNLWEIKGKPIGKWWLMVINGDWMVILHGFLWDLMVIDGDLPSG